MDESKDRLASILDTYEEGRVYREGIHVVLAGRPNVGKSSLLNALLKEKRAIVTAIPGTTRDMIEEIINIKGIPVNLIDTAGIRETSDVIEEESIKRTKSRLKEADLVLYIIDNEGIKMSDREVLDEGGEEKNLLVINKEDLLTAENKLSLQKDIEIFRPVFISAKTEKGIKRLKDTIHETVMKHGVDTMPAVVVSRQRHKVGIEKALASIESAERGVRDRRPYELVSSDVRDALTNIAEVAGETTTEDLLDRIFGEFCIGK